MLDGGVPGVSLPSAFLLPGGESCKRWENVERILAWLSEQKMQRDQPLVVMGGGAVLDLGALAASLYRRGVPLILVPTTLLGMVDATLGGKTAVDFELGGRLLKNFAGTFYPAQEVWISLDYLRTLPLRERVSGAGEVYKTLWLKGGKWPHNSLTNFVDKTELDAGLQQIVADCLKFKGKLVSRDPLDDQRVREALNFGHSIGHALEAESGLSHGECVLWGMAVELSLLPAAKGMLASALTALRELKLELPQQFEKLLAEEWLKHLSADKKSKGNSIEMSLPASPGKIVKKKFTPAKLVSAIQAFPALYRREEARRRS